MSNRSRPPQVQTSDPLADLRAESPAALTITDAPPTEDQTPDTLATGPQAVHDQYVGQIVAGWHQDTTAQGFAHKGGACGCRYLAAGAVQALMGSPVEVLEPVE